MVTSKRSACKIDANAVGHPCDRCVGWFSSDLGDDHVAGVDAKGHSGTVVLLAVDALNVDDILAAVDLGDLAVAALEGSADNANLVVLADRHGAHLPSHTATANEARNTQKEHGRHAAIEAIVRARMHPIRSQTQEAAP